MQEDDLVTAAAPNLEVKGAAGSGALSGLLLVLTGVQILDVRWVDAWMNYGRFVFLVLGALLFVLAMRVYRGDHKANLAALVVAGLSSVVGVGWFFVMNVAAVAMTGLATLLFFLALGHTRKMTAARQRLADEGMSLGL
jgi:hypothetical protein